MKRTIIVKGYTVVEQAKLVSGGDRDKKRSRRFHVRSAADEFLGILRRIEPKKIFRVHEDLGVEIE